MSIKEGEVLCEEATVRSFYSTKVPIPRTTNNFLVSVDETWLEYGRKAVRSEWTPSEACNPEQYD